jgi:hypothetical protein
MATAPVPADLIRSVLDSDRAAPGCPRLPDGGRNPAARWLTSVLVNHDDFEAHLDYLRGLLGLPPARRVEVADWRAAHLHRLAGVLHLDFPRRQPVGEDQTFAVIDHGPDAAADGTLAELLINPAALELLGAMVEDATSGYWAEQFRQSARGQSRGLPPALLAVVGAAKR